MEQEPIPGQDPLKPPDPRVAQAYLDVLPDLQSRREVVIDRRRLARLASIEGLALAAYLAVFLTGWMLQHRAGTATATPIAALGVYVAWVSLAAGLRERYGARLPLTPPQRAVQMLLIVGAIVAFIGVITAELTGPSLSLLWAALPAVFGAASGFWAQAILSRAARDQLRRAAPPHEEFTVAGRITTVICGICLTACVVPAGLAAQPHTGVISAFTCAVVMFVLVFGQLSGRLTAVGAMWRGPQWGMFGSAATAAATVVMLLGVAPDAAIPVSIVLGTLVLLASTVVSLLPDHADD